MDQTEMCNQCINKCPEKKLEEKFKSYRSVICDLLDKLGLKQRDAIIGGSMSLYCQDFPVTDIGDIDLEIQHKEGLIPKLELLAAANPSPELHNYAGDRDPNHYTRVDFFFRGVKFNVWLVPSLDDRPYMWMDYLKYGSVMSILEYKFKYAREKDIEYYLRLDSIFKGWLLSKKSK